MGLFKSIKGGIGDAISSEVVGETERAKEQEQPSPKPTKANKTKKKKKKKVEEVEETKQKPKKVKKEKKLKEEKASIQDLVNSESKPNVAVENDYDNNYDELIVQQAKNPLQSDKFAKASALAQKTADPVGDLLKSLNIPKTRPLDIYSASDIQSVSFTRALPGVSPTQVSNFCDIIVCDYRKIEDYIRQRERDFVILSEASAKMSKQIQENTQRAILGADMIAPNNTEEIDSLKSEIRMLKSENARIVNENSILQDENDRLQTELSRQMDIIEKAKVRKPVFDDNDNDSSLPPLTIDDKSKKMPSLTNSINQKPKSTLPKL